MFRKTAIVILGVAALAGVSVGFQAQTVPQPDSLPPGVTPTMIERGYEIYHGEGMCINCHGPHAAGMLGPKLADSEWWHAKGAYLSIVRSILLGTSEEESVSGNEMPARGGADITDAQVFAVSAYVWSLSHPRADSLPLGVRPELVKQGRNVFSGAGGCVDCHGADATGQEGPNLTDDEWLHAKGSYLAIVRQILVGVPAEQSRTGVVMPPRGGSGISDHDIHAVAAYVWAISRAR